MNDSTEPQRKDIPEGGYGSPMVEDELPTDTTSMDPAVPPSGTGCVECLESGGWWMRLRRCASCGQVGCCDSSPGQHASAHAQASGHSVVQSFEPGEDRFWDYDARPFINGLRLAEPTHHPLDQPAPGGGRQESCTTKSTTSTDASAGIVG